MKRSASQDTPTTTRPTTTLFRCQLQVQVVTCASDQLQIRGYTTTSQVPLIARVAYRTQENSFSSVTQSCPTLCDPMDYSIAGFSITNSQSLLKLMSIKLVMPSNHLILCHPLLLLPSIFPSIRAFSNELALHIRWPKYWSFSFHISSSNECSGLISFRTELHEISLPCALPAAELHPTFLGSGFNPVLI